MLFTIVLTPKLNAYVSMTITILFRLLWPCLYSEILLNFTPKGSLLGLIEEKSLVLAQLPLLHKARQSPTVPRWSPWPIREELSTLDRKAKLPDSVPLESNFRNLNK